MFLKRFHHCLSQVRIAHQIGGRVRLKFSGHVPDFDGVRKMTLEEVEALCALCVGIEAVHINLLARSCTVNYDQQRIPDQAWPDLLAGRATAAAGALEAVLRDACKQLQQDH